MGICQITVRKTSTAPEQSQVGKIVFVDPAGTERLSKGAASEDVLLESRCINKHFTVMGNVIRAYVNGGKSVRYSDSKLAMILKDCMANMFLIVTCSPAALHRNESFASLRFAQF